MQKALRCPWTYCTGFSKEAGQGISGPGQNTNYTHLPMYQIISTPYANPGRVSPSCRLVHAVAHEEPYLRPSYTLNKVHIHLLLYPISECSTEGPVLHAMIISPTLDKFFIWREGLNFSLAALFKVTFCF